MILNNILIFVILYFVKNSISQNEIIVIGTPSFVCQQDGSMIKIEPEYTEIRLPEDNEALFSFNTERASNCNITQRCTLMTWKIIRDFEMYLNENYKNTGSTGTIQFRNDMLVMGFNYLLHVILKNRQNMYEEKEFNLTYPCQKDNFESSEFLNHLFLNIGTNQIYFSMPLIVNADFTFCGHHFYYYFQWTLITLNDEILLQEKSSELSIIPELVFRKRENTFSIRCQVIDTQSKNEILQEFREFIFVEQDNEIGNYLEIFLPFIYTTFNVGTPFSITAFIDNPNKYSYQVEWSCIYENTLFSICEGQNQSDLHIKNGFNKEGNCTITVTLRMESGKRSVSCIVIILSNVPSIEFHVGYPIKPEHGIEIYAEVSDLRTYCMVQWSENETNQNVLSTIPVKLYNISSKDATFLDEIVELGNVMVTKHFKLEFPKVSSHWPGLESNYYRLKLLVACPSIKEITDKLITKEYPDNFTSISGETIFFVNPTPSGVQKIEVIFQENKALSSEYHFHVHNNDSKTLLCKYGFLLEDFEVIFYSGINTFSAKTILPYNEDFGVETFVQVCDFQNRCAKKFGPLVKPHLNTDISTRHGVPLKMLF
ncbi:hypothetical protein ABEB36_004381 [Hypothenemus hampei]|uniref:Uncharacterized protein n=1 Tax=Hypothenemus hampei TaxID=57062 RepID=A0ABD1F6W6_HYPHA